MFSDGLTVWPGRTVRQMNTASEFLVSSFANVNLSISLKNIYNGYNLFFGNLGRTNYNVKHSLFFSKFGLEFKLSFIKMTEKLGQY